MIAPPIRAPFLDPAADAILAAASAPRRALFLDRDGVINVNHGYVHTAALTEWVPGVFELVAEAHARGYLVIVVTNQAGIGRGYYDEAVFLEYTAWMHARFAERDTRKKNRHALTPLLEAKLAGPPVLVDHLQQFQKPNGL